ncbi:carbohydrate kinase, YjeF related protein [Ignisphaera aggregans DSM 17230]|uniref:Bifunctional NAD(P)H-hydrate repair enzyme n=1 Tax=Ignisphaera aggregans (strain DSM 17230 / JCM 13409 / AQ1.S1) TaxID=583356 RepID=E0SQR8_IGNAA|nr:carbohydrate kinase, YjeF related protein [Ignisphaera aggregans DSM 17230]
MEKNVSYRMKICSVEEMRRIDEEVATKYGVDHMLLMDEAGSAIYSVIEREYGVYGKRFCVIAGTGNNGGDALVSARRLHSGGGIVDIFIVGDPSKYSDISKKNYELVKRIGLPITIVQSDGDIDKIRCCLEEADIVVVGLIGIGLRGEVTGIYRKVIELINMYSYKPIVSVDIPSGIGGNNGMVYGVAVKSSITVTFGLPKYGNILYPGYQYCGKLYVSFLSYPQKLLEEVRAELNIPVPPPERVRWGHKGTFGKFLAVAGARYYYGAPYYVSLSFLKAGGGYSRLAAPKSIVPYIASKASEVVYIPLEETSEGTIARSNYDYILRIVSEYDIDIVAMGPGTSLNDETQQLIRDLVEAIDRPIIVDGDGITAIAKDPSILKKRNGPTVLTPHLGEFSRLINTPIRSIQEDPIGILRKTCIELNSYIVLKGAHTAICYPDGYIFINMTGNPGMAKAGSGDVLTGTIAAMYGIGYRDIGVATRMGVLVHGLAGDLAADDYGEDGVTPDLIMEYLSKAMKILREDPRYIIDRYMPKII